MDRIPVIFDCDNTMGVPGCDIDDGLALLFLLGSSKIDLLGITCTYGNNSQNTVYENTLRLLKEWGRTDIPVYRGSDDPGVRKAFMETGKVPDIRIDRRSEASDFLTESARKHTGRLCIIATGSMTNLAGAAVTDPDFFGNVKTISCMGGVTGELLVGGIHVDELNLSCDPEASYRVLTEGDDVRIATAQNCLKSYFARKEFDDYLEHHPGHVADMLRRETAYWFDIYERKWNCPGFVNWDVMAVMQLLETESLDMNRWHIMADTDSLRRGALFGRGRPFEVTLPEIRDHDLYFRTVYEHFFNASVTL